ncbi:hypothetical protein YEEN111655_19395 [Yersinia entomophaga]
MARQTKPLSVKEIESAKPKEADYVLYDGDGLELLIKSTGSKIWQFRYIRPVTRKRAKKSIGPYPSVTLADARSYRAEARALLAKQIDPQEHQQEQLRSSLDAKTNTFQLVAERWWNVKKASVTEDYPETISDRKRYSQSQANDGNMNRDYNLITIVNQLVNQNH